MHENLRTDIIRGEAMDLPMIGHPFRLLSDPLVDGTDLRVVLTTPVKSIKMDEGDYVFRTSNSLYKLEVMEREDEKQDHICGRQTEH